MVLTFILTESEVHIIDKLSLAASIVSIVLCLFILCAIMWVWSRKHARPILDRISFRLFWWAMVFELLYDIEYIIGKAYRGGRTNHIACSVGLYALMSTMGVVNYLCTCIAVNLMLIICFGINPIKRRLERWYVGLSIGLGFFIPIIPTALGHFGLDPILKVCWISAVNDEQRMLYLVVDLYLWQLLACVIATVAVAMSIYHIFRLRRATSKAMYMSNTLNRSGTDSAGGRLAEFDDQFLRMALRISTYPVVMIIVNGLISAIDLYISDVGGVHSRTAYALYTLYYFLYGGRGIFFALLGLFVDPCLRKGMRAAWRGPDTTFQPPLGLTAPTEDFSQKKSDFDTSFLPSVSYSPGAIVSASAPWAASTNPAESASNGRRESEMDIIAAITQIQPDHNVHRAAEDDVHTPAGNIRRATRKEVDEAIL